MTREELVDYYAQLCEKYPIILLEDGCNQDDWDGFQKLMIKMNGKHIQIVGYAHILYTKFYSLSLVMI